MQRPRLLAFALAAGLLAYHSTASAQETTRPQTSATDSGRRMFDPVGRLLDQRDELKLSNEQASRLEEIRTRYLQKHQGQVEQLRRDREARAAFRASMDSTRTEVMAVLTPEQQQQVKEMRKQHRKEWREKHGGRHGHRHDGPDDDDDR